MSCRGRAVYSIGLKFWRLNHRSVVPFLGMTLSVRFNSYDVIPGAYPGHHQCPASGADHLVHDVTGESDSSIALVRGSPG